eukprot:Seg2848.3 transcript_id=Seg2848.3/GoldUCD/mRNA.D3Y31 product="hypothetical protein" protein_id=Seg2848.3/GoldUCD/D3Y31
MITDEVKALSKTWKRALAVRQNLFKLDLKNVAKQNELDCKAFLQEQNVQKDKLLVESEKREKIKKRSVRRQRAHSRSEEDLHHLNSQERNLACCEREANDFAGCNSTAALARLRRQSRSEQDLRGLPSARRESMFITEPWEEVNSYILPKIQLRPPLFASSTHLSAPMTPPKLASPGTSPRMRKQGCVKVPEVRRKISTERMEKLQPIGRNAPAPVICTTDKMHTKSLPSRYVSSPLPIISSRDSRDTAKKRMSSAKDGLIAVGSRSLDMPSPVVKCTSSSLNKGRGSLVRSESVPELSHANESVPELSHANDHPVSNLKVSHFDGMRATSAAAGLEGWT